VLGGLSEIYIEAKSLVYTPHTCACVLLVAKTLMTYDGFGSCFTQSFCLRVWPMGNSHMCHVAKQWQPSLTAVRIWVFFWATGQAGMLRSKDVNSFT